MRISLQEDLTRGTHAAHWNNRSHLEQGGYRRNVVQDVQESETPSTSCVKTRQKATAMQNFSGSQSNRHTAVSACPPTQQESSGPPRDSSKTRICAETAQDPSALRYTAASPPDASLPEHPFAAGVTASPGASPMSSRRYGDCGSTAAERKTKLCRMNYLPCRLAGAVIMVAQLEERNKGARVHASVRIVSL